MLEGEWNSPKWLSIKYCHDHRCCPQPPSLMPPLLPPPPPPPPSPLNYLPWWLRMVKRYCACVWQASKSYTWNAGVRTTRSRWWSVCYLKHLWGMQIWSIQHETFTDFYCTDISKKQSQYYCVVFTELGLTIPSICRLTGSASLQIYCAEFRSL